MWPQYVLVSLLSIDLVLRFVMHGRTTKINGFTALWDFVFTIWILWMGGFFS